MFATYRNEDGLSNVFRITKKLKSGKVKVAKRVMIVNQETTYFSDWVNQNDIFIVHDDYLEWSDGEFPIYWLSANDKQEQEKRKKECQIINWYTS